MVQLATLMMFVLLTVAGLGVAWLPEDLFSRLDPLVALAAILASRTRISLWAAAFVTVAATALIGRGWCGWVCPVGTLLDLLPARAKAKRPGLPRALRLGKYALLALVVGAALLGRLGPMVLDPVTVFTRPLQEIARPYVGADSVARNVGPELASSIHAFALLSLLPLAAVLALNALGRRTWCRSLCPLGGLLALLAKAPGFRRVVDANACISCGKCARVCPTEAIEPEAAFASSSAECTVCMECFDACPKGAISLGSDVGQLLAPGYRPDRRAALVAAGATGLSLAVAALPVRIAQAIERPPATDDARLSELCIRCGACYSACIAGALRPSLSFTNEAGPWTPMLDERPAYCGLDCNRCAKACPTDALHTPTPEERVAWGLGTVAQIDRNRCRAWANGRACMRCQGACPVNGAILAVDRREQAGGGPQISVPLIDPEQCIGCNLCAQVCPARFRTAIYAPELPPGAGF